jgi:hypothetical protein
MNISFYDEKTFLETEADAVLCASDSNLIRGVTCHKSDEGITIHCNPKLERLDKMNDGVIWMLDKTLAKQHPEPYISIDTDKSETIWTKPVEVKT